ncbi:hypothetical protein Sste5346_007982 [Sporothrix stenoceras]|uniref:Uncharacterized protein n=1 Tax=Sporothrix stenoceras TaxID=5173 RepID=A0ABR3YR60_9PEZI
MATTVDSTTMGCANRSAYDLTVHAKHTGSPLHVEVTRPVPVEVEAWQADLDGKVLGPQFKMDAKKIEAAATALDQPTLASLALTSSRKKQSLPCLLPIPWRPALHLWSCPRTFARFTR